MLNDIFIYCLENLEGYPSSPFHPSEIFPEFSQLNYTPECDSDNEMYMAVRSVLYNLGLDRDNYGTPQWNPFINLVSEGQTVLIKPNFVKAEHPLGKIGSISMITNASLMRPIIDYVLIATKGNVTITIGDVPIQYSKWDKIIDITGTKQLVEYYHSQNIDIALVDMRREIAIYNKDNIIEKKIMNPLRNDNMYRAVDLGNKSELIDVIEHSKQFEITDYGYGTVQKHHNEAKNEYLVPLEVLQADLFINLPKLKTHRKAGLTCAMKNLIGINGDKSWIAHHRRGLKSEGGDEFNEFDLKTYFKVRIWSFLKTNKIGVKIARLIKKFFKKFIWKGKSYEEVSMESTQKYFFEGSWHGNDTIWRCIKDLNKIMLYANEDGKMCEKKQRKYLCIVDGLLSGEGEGPMEHTPKKTNLIFGGTNPVYVDFTATKIMGFDYLKIPTVCQGFNNRWWALTDKKANEVLIDSNDRDWKFSFKPSKGWSILDNHKDIES